MSHISTNRVTHINGTWVIHIYKLCHTHEFVMAYIWMRDITHIHESCHTYESFMSHVQIIHVTRINESCHTNKSVVSRIWMSQVTHMNESCQKIHFSQVTHIPNRPPRAREKQRKDPCGWVTSHIYKWVVSHLLINTLHVLGWGAFYKSSILPEISRHFRADDLEIFGFCWY